MDDYYEKLNQQPPFAKDDKPCECCGVETKGRFKSSEKACCPECWSKLPVMD